jgi:TonB family protein
MLSVTKASRLIKASLNRDRHLWNIRSLALIFLAALTPFQSAESSVFVSSKGYPAQAALRREHGSTIVEIDVDAKGSLTNCRVSRSSTFEDLDKAACDSMPRAKFKPAIDTAGNPISGTTTLTLHWILPDANETEADLPFGNNEFRIIYLDNIRAEFPAIAQGSNPKPFVQLNAPNDGLKYPGLARRLGQQGRTVAALAMDANGQPRKCHVIRSSRYGELDQAVCKHLLTNMKYSHEVDDAGNAVASVDIISMVWSLKKKNHARALPPH